MSVSSWIPGNELWSKWGNGGYSPILIFSKTINIEFYCKIQIVNKINQNIQFSCYVEYFR